jgi:phenylpyruvate tautomerase PptA (4-oxalocrotonate tautomerase family)
VPVVEIRALPQKPPVDVPHVLSRVCTDLAAALDVPEKKVWATWQSLEERHYVEGREDAPDQASGTHPPLVRVQAFEGRSEETIRKMLDTVAASVSAALGVEPGNVMVVYEELRSGRVWSGGGILD